MTEELIDWPTPILSDDELELLGQYFEQHRLWDRGVRFILFCHVPHWFGYPPLN